MANLNKVLLLGRLTRDPKNRYTPKGTAVADLSLAVNNRVPDGNGGYRDDPVFIDVTVWGRTAELAGQYLSKGRGCLVEGRLQMDSWEDKATGQKRSKLRVVGENLQFLPDGKRDADPRQASPREQRPQTANAPAEEYHEDDDIPF